MIEGVSTAIRMERVIAEVLAVVAPDIVDVEAGTRLLGDGAVVDSVGLVNLLVALEQQLPADVELASSFLLALELDSTANPFRCVGSLASHMAELARRDG